MMNNQPKLNIGDKIGFVTLGQDIDEKDTVVFFTVCEITKLDGETAYRYMYPDGEISRSAIKESNLDHYTVIIQPKTKGMICLSDRKAEFKKAFKRGLENDLVVFPDLERDCFVVTNRTKNTEYRVRLKTSENKVWAKCECPDFKFQKHICKHVAEVLQDSFFGVTESMGVVLYDK